MTTPEQPALPAPEKPKRTRTRKQAAATPLDPAAILTAMMARGDFSHNPETEAEEQSRLEIAKDDAKHRRHIEKVVLYAVLVVIALVCPACLWVLIDDSRPMERKAWAAPILTLIVGGLMGYVTGKSAGKPTDK